MSPTEAAKLLFEMFGEVEYRRPIPTKTVRLLELNRVQSISNADGFPLCGIEDGMWAYGFRSYNRVSTDRATPFSPFILSDNVQEAMDLITVTVNTHNFGYAVNPRSIVFILKDGAYGAYSYNKDQKYTNYLNYSRGEFFPLRWKDVKAMLPRIMTNYDKLRLDRWDKHKPENKTYQLIATFMSRLSLTELLNYLK